MDREQYSSGAAATLGAAGPVAPRGYISEQNIAKQTTLDSVRQEAERAAVRATEIRRRLLGLGERLAGPSPASGERQAGEAIAQSGFIPGTQFAMERVHTELTMIEDLLAAFEQTV